MINFLLLCHQGQCHMIFDYFTGCLLDPDVCDQHENCFDDYAFGRCVSPYDAYDGEYGILRMPSNINWL